MKLQFKKREIPEHLQKYFKPVQCEKGCYICHLIDIFREVKRALKPTGTVWVNLGDSYSGSGKGGQSEEKRSANWAPTYPKIAPVQREAAVTKGSGESRSNGPVRAKSLMNIPARFAIAMTDELDFIHRNEIIWHKLACMPSSAKDRFTVDFEPIFFFTKSPKYWFEQQLEPLAETSIARVSQSHYLNQVGSIANGGAKTNGNMKAVVNGDSRNMRTVWTVNFEPSGEEHYASYPTKLIETPIRAGCPEDGIVYDPFGGTATTAVVAHKLGRNWICSELQPKYAEIANRRLEPYLAQGGLFA